MASGKLSQDLPPVAEVSRNGAFRRAWSDRNAAYGRQGAAKWRIFGIKFLEEVGFGKKLSDLKGFARVRKD